MATAKGTPPGTSDAYASTASCSGVAVYSGCRFLLIMCPVAGGSLLPSSGPPENGDLRARASQLCGCECNRLL